MHIKKGKGRIVIVLPSICLVVKIPILQLWNTIKLTWKLFIKDKYSKKLFRIAVEGDYLRGLFENWREFIFWIRTRNQFLQPTYFSFFGLLNIQKMGSPLVIDDASFLIQMQYYTRWFMFEDTHSFGNLSNFCVDNDGKVKMTDYGSLRIRDIIERFGVDCHEKISLTFNAEKDGFEDFQKIGYEYSKFRKREG